MEQDNQLKQQLTEQQSLVSQRKTGTLHDVHAWRQAHSDSWRALRRKRNGALYAELQAMQISVSLEEATQRIAALQPQVHVQGATPLCLQLMLCPQPMLTSRAEPRAAPHSKAEA